MTTSIPNLWPEQLKVDVQMPYAILRVQADMLSNITQGILFGEVETEVSAQKAQHRLIVIAPAYDGYRHTLLVAIHARDWPYPVEIREKSLQIKVPGDSSNVDYPKANDQEQMLALVQQALGSDPTRAVINSLIAKCNEPDINSLNPGTNDKGDRPNE